MTYVQITAHERHVIAALRQEKLSIGEIAEHLDRHRSTIYREVRRNRCRSDGAYRSGYADARSRVRRWHSRRKKRFGAEDLSRVEELLKEKWSPEQISGRLKRMKKLSISHETIYQHIWEDRYHGGSLYTHLRCTQKQCRKRYGKKDSRGRLAGKRPIGDRPAGARNRSRFGHWEADTVMGSGDQHCIVTLVDRKTGYVEIGKLRARTVDALNKSVGKLMKKHPVKSITADNGTEFHGYKELERATGCRVYFATPYHSWERGTSENTNGLIRQYLPKRKSMSRLTQQQCEEIAQRLNNRPRKRLGFKTPKECYGVR